MLDIKLLREAFDHTFSALMSRHYDTLDKTLYEIVELDKLWRELKQQEDDLRAERNKLTMQIAQLKKEGKDVSEIIQRSSEISAKVKALSEERQDLEKRLNELLLSVPNIPHGSVPKGEDEEQNVEVRKWGTVKKTSKEVLSHYDIGHKTGLIDFERGVKLAQHRFTVLWNDIAKLERALINFMLSVNASRGYAEVAPPYLVNTKTITSTGHLPKFAHDQYKVCEEDLWLIPTAEVPLTSLFSGEIVEPPIKLMAYTPCFRREAGEYGRDIRGLIRQHQFDKVELVHIVKQDESFSSLEKLTNDAEHILQVLDLPYRVVELCTGDLGFSAAKTYDLEVWIPSQDKYREISSCSNCTDFQARRANIRYRDGDKYHFAHTLNGSGLAVGRTLIAILENYQEEDRIIVPKPLRDFMGQDEILIKTE